MLDSCWAFSFITEEIASANIININETHILLIMIEYLDTKRFKILARNDSNIVKETCWMMSNITAGTQEQVMKILNLDIMPLLIKMYFLKIKKGQVIYYDESNNKKYLKPLKQKLKENKNKSTIQNGKKRW